MWQKAGIIRTKKDLKTALKEITALEKKLKNYYNNKINKTVIETKSLIIAAKLIISSSLKRKISVGCFYLK